MGGYSPCSCTISELLEVLCYFCLDLGCQYTRGKVYLSAGNLDAHVVEDRCETLCSICTKEWHKQFVPVHHFGVVAFLENLMQTGKLPQKVDYKSPILSLVAGSTSWKEAIFDCAAGGKSRLQVNTFFLSLTMLGMIHLQPSKECFQWSIKQVNVCANDRFIEETIGSPFYKRDNVWHGMNLLV
jgi:hypothetical protein